jgi:hypothetical protein
MITALIGSILILSTANAKSTFTFPAPTNPLQSISVTDASGYLSNGTLDVISFLSNNGSIWAVCKLRGIVDGINIDEDCICPVTIGDCVEIPPRLDNNSQDLKKMSNNQQAKPFHCDCVVIRIGTCTIRRVTGNIDTNPQNVECTVRDYSSELLCSIHNTPRILTNQLAVLLNQLL